jgi:preprotein translocase subunit SecF
VSPFEHHDDQLRELQLGGESGQTEPEPEPELPTSDGDGTGDGQGPVDGATADAATAEGPTTDDERQEELADDEHERQEVRAEAKAGHGPGPFRRLYRGETSFDFVGRRKWWFTISAIVILAGVISLGVRGLNLGITFRGGTAWEVKTSTLTQAQAESVVQAAGLSQPTVEVLGRPPHQTIEVSADLKDLSTAARTAERTKVTAALARAAHVSPKEVSQTFVGSVWGGQVTKKMIIALVVFFVVVAIYISLRFEPKMALAAFIALLHDLLVTAGVYSLLGFQVSADTVIAVLTILGYSLYDTVVVFDRVRDNTKGFGASGRMTYSEMINLSMNQTLARSINTSLVAILPVLSILVIGAQLLGATTLQDYGLALTVGLISGAYSSIFIASPALAMMKEREPRYMAIRQRLETRGERLGLLTPAAAALAAAGGGAAGGAGTGRSRPAQGRPGGTLRPGAAKGAAPVKVPAGASALVGGADSAASPGNGAAVATKVAPGPGGKGGSRPGGSSQGRRPSPRPRKGKGKGKKRR